MIHEFDESFKRLFARENGRRDSGFSSEQTSDLSLPQALEDRGGGRIFNPSEVTMGQVNTLVASEKE